MSNWDVPWPRSGVPGWFEYSSWAERDWEIACNRYDLARYELRGFPWCPDPTADPRSVAGQQARVDREIENARAELRRRVLGWYRKLCWPLQSGEVVPNRVAQLQWEQWDLDGCDAVDVVNL